MVPWNSEEALQRKEGRERKKENKEKQESRGQTGRERKKKKTKCDPGDANGSDRKKLQLGRGEREAVAKIPVGNVRWTEPPKAVNAYYLPTQEHYIYIYKYIKYTYENPPVRHKLIALFYR